MPRRILSKMKSKIVKAESRDKSRNAVFQIWLCRDSPAKDKIKVRDQEQRQIGKHSFRDLAMRPSFIIFAPEAQSARNERDKNTVEANAAWEIRNRRCGSEKVRRKRDREEEVKSESGRGGARKYYRRDKA